MCPIHHDVVDADPTSYTFERLREIKAGHESKFQHGLEPPDDIAAALVRISNIDVEQGSVLVAINQSGGQIAHSITNILSQSVKAACLQPVITRVDEESNRELHTLELRLKSVGDAKASDALVNVSIPQRLIRHNWQPGQKPLRAGRYEFERDTAFFVDQNFFQQLYPKQTSKQVALAVHYFVDPADQSAASEEVHIEVRSGDTPSHVARLSFAQLAELEPRELYLVSTAEAGGLSELSPALRAG